MAQENRHEADVLQWVIKHTERGTGEALPPDFPYIIDNVSGEICQMALLYMADMHLTRKLTFNANTVGAYTSDLLDWMRFCARFDIPWNKATWADLGNYVDSTNLVSPHHKESFQQSTVSRRLVPIQQLYQWASENLPDLCTEAPEGTLFKPANVAYFLDDRRKERRQQVDNGKESTEDVSLPNVMQPSEVEAVLKAIGPAPRPLTCNKSADGAGSPVAPHEEHDKSSVTSMAHLGMDIGCQAGLRVGEVVGLRVKLFVKFNETKILPNRHYQVGPFRRKGGKFKTVKFHGVLLQKVLDYIDGERKQATRGCGADHGVLLVHKDGRFRGLAITKSTLQRRFSTACIVTGLTRSVSKVKPVDGDWMTTTTVDEKRAAFTFHDLRHTFAVWMYYARKSDGDAEPWKYIQEQLGHEDVATTMHFYLTVTQDFEAYVSDKFIVTLNSVAAVVADDSMVEAV